MGTYLNIGNIFGGLWFRYAQNRPDALIFLAGIKEKLFKETVEELKKTFQQNDLEKLQNLYFDFSTEVEDTSNLDTYDTGESETIELAE